MTSKTMIHKISKWNRIFRSDNNALIVALDHIADGFMHGWEFPEATLERIIAGKPDAILLNFGILKQFASMLSEVGIILRLDGGSTYLVEQWPNCTRWERLYSVEDALALGAHAVIASVFVGGPAELDSMKVAATIVSDCLKHEVPCALHAIPVKGMLDREQYDAEMVAFASRFLAELGADFINTYFPGDQERFRVVTSRCPVPVLAAGGPKVKSDETFLNMAKDVLDAGGHGLFVGRNVWQHQDPESFLLALKRVIHPSLVNHPE